MLLWAWVSFWIVSLIWGSSFLLIRIGIESVPAGQMVFIRVVTAMIGLYIVMRLRGHRLPRDRASIRDLIIIGVFNATIPYVLIAWGEKTVTSSLTSVLQATVSMFTLLIAHFTLADERMTFNKVLGLVLGFAGVVVLTSGANGSEGENTLMGQIAIIGASLSYAAGTVYVRRTVSGRLKPIVVAAGSFIPATVCAIALMLGEWLIAGEAPVDLTAIPSDQAMAVLLLGFLNTFVAYLFFYYIVQQLGAFRAANVTYVVPVVAIVLGALVLGEIIDTRFVIGAALIFSGLGAINMRWGILRRRRAVGLSAP